MTFDPREQIQRLEGLSRTDSEIVPFASRIGPGGLTPVSLATLQINVGKLCNQTCRHCHVDAGPTRKEVMTRETFEHCLKAIDGHEEIRIVDLTGGAPEMNPHFRWFVEQVRARGRHLMVRCNLTILEAHAKYADLPEFFAKHDVEVVSSLPSFAAATTDRQRGNGVFEKSIRALRKLNAVGYGHEARLMLHLVYNPNGAFLPADQSGLEREFKDRLGRDHDIVFNRLFTITNMPISRFFEYLVSSDNLKPYLAKLNRQFNPAAVDGVMCRSMISVSWDGRLYDCDFNQMLDLEVRPPMTIERFNAKELMKRKIAVGMHCYGCTAGAGSSCGGSVA